MKLTETALRLPVTTIMAFLSVVMIGLISTRLIPLEFFPELDQPRLTVDLPYSGSSPEEIERQITKPAEEALLTVPGVRNISSYADANGGNVNLRFEWGTDTKQKAIDVREKLDNVRNQFPSDFKRYFVRRDNTGAMPILELRVSSARDLSNSYDLLDRKIKRRLERLEGVARVDLNGVEPKELRIELMSDRVAAHKIDLAKLSQDLQRANFAVSAGVVTDGGRRLMLRPIGALTTQEEVGNLIVASNGLRLRDIANIIYDEPIVDYGRHLDREFAIAIEVSKEAGANTVAVSRRILDEIEMLKDDPDMQGISLYEMENLSNGIVSSINQLLKSGVIGAFLAFFVLFFFLRRVSTTLIVAMAVPISLLITVGVLYFIGLTLNVLTMMGLMIAVGMLVDNAVVVTESIHRHQLLDPANPRSASIRGVKEVSLAVTAGTFTTAIVFLPMIVTQADEISLFLKHVSITICVALAASLVISLTIVPMLMSRLRPQQDDPKETIVDRMVTWYTKTLAWTLRHPRWSSLFAFLTLASVIIPAQFVSTDFFDDENGERRIRLHYHLDGTYALERVEDAVNVMEEYLYANQEKFEIESVYSWYTPSVAQSTLLLTSEDDKKLDTEDLEKLIAENLPKLAIARPNFSWRSNRNDREGVRVTIRGESSTRLAELSHELERIISQMPGFINVLSEAEEGRDEIHVNVDPQKAQRFGLTTNQIARTLSTAMRGQDLQRFHSENGEVSVRLQFQDQDKRTLDDLANLTVDGSASGTPTRLASVASIRRTTGPQGIYRENRMTLIGVHAALDGIEQDEARKRLRQMLNQFDFPAGYSWSFGQQFSNEEESQQIMLRNMLLALILIYLVMAGLFESLIHPAAIWFSIAFAIVGVFWFFLATGTGLQIMAMIGLLVLIGVVVNNGIVLVEHINTLRGQGVPRSEAILQAGRDRFRPIIMTAGTTVLGLIPLCIGKTLIGGDGPPYYPMARAIVGGLSFSTLVTLLILPTIYILMDNLRNWSK
ncbi:MAG: efflux RND transporter permease subunit, partial [Rhodothermales bacterium]|nr:efflux RND transporter permease subunit [Rhodothermales bacterium]